MAGTNGLQIGRFADYRITVRGHLRALVCTRLYPRRALRSPLIRLGSGLGSSFVQAREIFVVDVQLSPLASGDFPQDPGLFETSYGAIDGRGAETQDPGGIGSAKDDEPGRQVMHAQSRRRSPAELVNRLPISLDHVHQVTGGRRRLFGDLDYAFAK